MVAEAVGKYAMPHTLDEALVLIESVCDAEIVAVDTETSGLNTWDPDVVIGGIALSSDAHVGVYIPIRHRTATEIPQGKKRPKYEFAEGHYMNQDPGAVLRCLRTALTGKAVVMHNAKYDGEMFATDPTCPFDVWKVCSQVHDTMIMSQLLNDKRGVHSLKLRAKKDLNMPPAEQDRIKAWLKAARTDNYLNIPPDLMCPYAAGDTHRTLLLYKQYITRIWDEKLISIYEVEMKLMPIITSAELMGTKIDTEYMAEQAAEGHTKMQEALDAVEEIAGHPVNLASEQEIDKLWAFELGLERKYAERYHKGKGYVMTPTYDAETLRSIDHPLVEHILKYRKYAKLTGTYFEGLLKFIDKDGRLHPQFFQNGTVTGRMSASAPNMQNVPRGPDVRRAFLVDTNERMIFIDYSQFEYRMFVHYCQDERLIKAYNDDPAFDIHQTVTDMLHAEDRDTGKTLNFAMLYGMGAKTYSKKYLLTYDQAKALYGRYHRSLPAVQKFTRLAAQTMRRRGYVRTLFGRRRRYDGDNDWKATNSLIQGSTSDFFKAGLVALADVIWPERDLFDSPFRLFIHDEVVISMPEHFTDLETLLKPLVELMELRVPVRAEAKSTTTNWSEAEPWTLEE